MPDPSRLMLAQDTQIWIARVVFSSDPTSVQIGGSVRLAETEG